MSDVVCVYVYFIYRCLCVSFATTYFSFATIYSNIRNTYINIRNQLTRIISEFRHNSALSEPAALAELCRPRGRQVCMRVLESVSHPMTLTLALPLVLIC
jgi:hypothetical protein